jgi:putative ABC transport system permease protein
MFQEWRTAVRSLIRRRGLAITVILTLAIGIGANSAIFSAIDAVLLRPLPYPGSDRLIAVSVTNVAMKQLPSRLAPAQVEDWNRESGTLEGLAGSYFENVTDTTGSLPERLEAVRTSPRFFAVLGTPAALGRTFSAGEEIFGGPRTVVISDAFWRARFGGDPQAVGRALVLAGEPRMIVGVMPPAFRFPTAATQVWISTQAPEGLLRYRQARYYSSFARLRPGATPADAQRDLSSVQARLGEQFPDTDRGWSAIVVPLKEEQVGGVRRSLSMLLTAVLLVLLAACANVACLLLADATRREHEVAVRIALGAPRRTIVRQLLREGLVLSLAGSTLGLLLARWGIALLRTAQMGLPRAEELRIDLRLVAFTFALALVTTIVFALVPALQATRREIMEGLARGGRGGTGGRQPIQRVLVSAQVTLAIVLLVGASLLVRSFALLQAVPPGFDPGDVLTLRVSAAWAESQNAAAVTTRQLRTLERLSAIPGVTSAAMNTILPVSKDLPPSEFTIIGRPTGEEYFAAARQVSADYFRTLRVPFLAGATCRDDPRPDAPRQVVVSAAFASRFFPGQQTVGQRLAQRGPSEIVGVVADVREQGLMKDPEPIMYSCGLMPYWPDPYYLVRSDPARPVTIAAVRQAVREIEPLRAVYDAAPLTERIAASLSRPRLNMTLLTTFAGTTLVLAAIGLYGMLAQFVAFRRREIGVRLALGARRADILGRILAHAASVVGVGLALGLAGAFVLARFMASLVFGIPARDPVTFAIVPLLLAAMAAAAAAVPARRAVRVDPVQALRDE